MAYKRDLYLTILNKDFNIVYEAKLPSNRLNPYTGWTVVNDGIIFFAYNIYNRNDTDNLILDIINPVFKEAARAVLTKEPKVQSTAMCNAVRKHKLTAIVQLESKYMQ